ncbi:Uncharacterised protein r2_g1403 [Pycnogonum litorale]
MTATLSTGYGPSRRLYFDGDQAKYELWEVKFLGQMRFLKLHDVLVPRADENEPPCSEKNCDAFAELIQYLDDRSLSLVIRDARDDGRKALKILRDHYLGNGKPRVIALYTELTSLVLGKDESITDYVIRAETAANSLKMAGESISDSLLIAMVLKGLTSTYKTFSAIITHQDKVSTFCDFKSALRSYDEGEKYASNMDDGVMNVKPIDSRAKNTTCFRCGKAGHKSFQCKQKTKWCNICNAKSHSTKECRKRDTVKSASSMENEKDHSFAFKVTVDPTTCESTNELLVDCGATAHIITNKSSFLHMDTSFNPDGHFIELADGSRTNGIVHGKGVAEVSLIDVHGFSHKVKLSDALYIPTYKQNIFSVHAATDKGAIFNFSRHESELITPQGTKFKIKNRGRLYYINSLFNSRCDVRSHTLSEWHTLLGHCNTQDILKLEKISGDMKVESKAQFHCETCVEGKMPQFRSRVPDERATSPCELVHCDLAGPLTPCAHGGHRYAINFIDDFSGAATVYFLKQKSDAAAATRRFLADIAPYGSVGRIRTDNGTEFTGSNFQSVLLEHKIKHEMSAPYSPHQNGTAERAWRTLFEMARCLLLESKLPKYLWTYAVATAAYIRNRCFNPRTGKTPYENLTGRKPNLCKLHVFGSVCFAYVQNKTKLDARSRKGKFVGYDQNSPAYLVYFPEDNTILKVRCVNFTERFESQQPNMFQPENVDVHPEFVPLTHHGGADVVDEPEVNNTDSTLNGDSNPNTHIQDTSNEDKRYPDRNRTKPKYLDDYVENTTDYTIDYFYKVNDIPRCYHEAISSPEAQKWNAAMEEELHALDDNKTFELLPVPNDRSVIGSRWVYNIKSDTDGGERFKARFVAKGYSQIPHIDYQETFSPTARLTSLRMLINVAANESMIVHQMDVKTAYLNAPIDREIYVEQPKGYEKFGKNGKKLVLKLTKSLYGLKQSGRNWHNILHDHFMNEKFTQSQADTCVYTKLDEMSKVIILIWVDDIIIATNSSKAMKEVKLALSNKFKMKDMGELSYFLGIQFKCKDNMISMNQTKYIEKILSKFDMHDCKMRSTPCEIGLNKFEDNHSELLETPTLYQEIVGSLIYLMTATRPDLSYVVSKLSQHMAKPRMVHLSIAKHVMRYLKGTKHYSLKFCKTDEPLQLLGFSDSDWGSSRDRHSISGYCFRLSNGSSLISWRSRRQPIVALSTCEAEYIALAATTQEAKFLKQILRDISNKSVETVILNVDNQGAIALAKNPVHHQRSKHIDIRYHFIRDEVERGDISLTYVSSEDNVADVFTKPLAKVKINGLLGY